MHSGTSTYNSKFHAAFDDIIAKLKLGTLHHDDIEHTLALSSDSKAFLDLIINLFKSGNLKAAEHIAIATLRHYPNCYSTLNALGVILKNQHHLKEAVIVLRKAVSINQKLEHAWINLGNCLLQLEECEEALNCSIELLKHHPTHIEALYLKARSHIKLKDHPQATTVLLQALAIEPNNLDLILDLLACYHNYNEYHKVLDCIDHYLEQLPNNIELLRRKALACIGMNKLNEGIQAIKAILQLKPDDADANFRLGELYLRSNQPYDLYKAHYLQAYNLQPNNNSYLLSLCAVLSFNQANDGDLDQAHQLVHKCLKSADLISANADIIQRIALRTMDYSLYAKVGSFEDTTLYFAKNNINTSLLYQMGQARSVADRHTLVQAHRIWGESLEQSVHPTPIKQKVKQRLNNKVRLGVLSLDLKMNQVGRFIYPLLKDLDKSKFELYCYAMDKHSNDYMEQYLINNADSFQVDEGNNAITSQSIADDGIDILIEISAWHRKHIGKIVAAHPADMQISWLDYPGSIGLPTAIDYIVTDPYITPSDPTLLIEKQLLMPNTWVTTVAELFNNADINYILPEDRNGYITFGTMNSVHKLNVESLKLWAEIMHHFPNSRFLYVRPDTSSKTMKDNFCKYMKDFGIDATRISFVNTRTIHLHYYNEIDIAFDTFPHTGGTTTCEALWMGVPVVSLVGTAFFERISYSNLNNSGLGDLCAFDHEQYKNITINLAHDKARRQYLRQNLRHQILQHPLGQPQEFAANFSKCLLNVWGK